MGLMIVVTSTCARSPQAAKLLHKIASLVNSRTAALIVLMLFGYVTSMLNWAFCTIVTPILAMHLAKRIKGLHFPMMVADGYSCMILSQCLGPSATLYSNLATEGSDYAKIVGQSMSVADTCYNPMNIILWVVLAVVFILLVLFTRPGQGELVELGNIATARTLPIFSFLSACLVNLFVPSQGGQFTVQGPLIVQAASQIEGSNLVNCLNAFVYGDECTNLLQPLYVIPALPWSV